MNLLMTDWNSEREWNLAWDIVRVQEQRGPLSLREQLLGEIAGSPERALRILATVRKYRNSTQSHVRHAPRRHSGSSVTQRPARRTATARAGRTSDLAAHLTIILVTLAFAAFVLWEVAK